MKVEWIEDPHEAREPTPYEGLQKALDDIFLRYLSGDLDDEQAAAVTEYLQRNTCPECGR